MKRVQITEHAEAARIEREIDPAWIIDTISSAEFTERDPTFPNRTRAFKRIAAFGGRWLRVVYEGSGDDLTIITVHFDRTVTRRRR